MSIISHLYRLLRRYYRHKAKEPTRTPLAGRKLGRPLGPNLEHIARGLGYSSDLIVKRMRLSWGPVPPLEIAVLYIEGMADHTMVQQSVLSPLLDRRPSLEQIKAAPASDLLKSCVLAAAAGPDAAQLQDVLLALLSGSVIILIEDSSVAINIPIQGWADREVTESTAQAVVRGPQDAFTENIVTNIALVRRRIKDPRIRCTRRVIGTATRTSVAVMHMDGIANDKLVEDLFRRLDGISLQEVLEGEYIEESITDNPYSLFPTVYNTDRPDSVAQQLLHGKIAIIVDGSPFTLVVPALFTDFLQSPEDHYQSFYYSGLIRVLRFVALLSAVFSPSIYIALTTFDQQMLPTSLLLSLAAQREGTPFPAFVEAVLMEVTFEILREAGIRMPRTIGQAVSIVGTIVIGQAAVDAGIVSAGMVIVVSLTAISSFAIPSYNLGIAARIVRFLFMLLAASFGLYGIFIGIIILVLHLSSLRSLGTPYMAPFGPKRNLENYDAMLRTPYWLERRK